MSFSFILILLGSECLLQREITAEICGKVCNHLGPNFNLNDSTTINNVDVTETSLYPPKGESSNPRNLLPSQVNRQTKPHKSPSFMVSTLQLQPQPHHLPPPPPPPPFSSKVNYPSSISSAPTSSHPHHPHPHPHPHHHNHHQRNQVISTYKTIAPFPLLSPQSRYEDSLARPFSKSGHSPEQISSGSSHVISTVIPTSPTSIASPSDSPSNLSHSHIESPSSATTSTAVSMVPLYLANPTFAPSLGLSTFITQSVLHGLSPISTPAMRITTGTGPFSGLLGSITGSKVEAGSIHLWRKRSNPPPPPSERSALPNAYRYRELPLLDHWSTRRLLGLLVNTLQIRKVRDDSCKKYYMCKVYRNALDYTTRPSLQNFETSLIDTFGIAVEREGNKLDFHATVKYFVDAAVVALMSGNCFASFPCETSQKDDKNRHLQYYPVTTSHVDVDSISKSKDINRSKENPKWNLKDAYEN